MSTSIPAPDDLDLRFEVVDLIGKPGSHRHVERAVTIADQTVGNLALTVPTGETIQVGAELESVVEGIYVGGTVQARVSGECSRCLDPLEREVDARIDELFSYPEKVKADEEEDVPTLSGDEVDLGPLVHDVIALESDDRPLCKPECMGLCAQCGARLEDDPDHHHEDIDPRWAALSGLLPDEGDSPADGTDAGSSPEDRADGQR
ncbi:metal-binding protein [Brachybacterium endophyticum]|uniref:Metal-binding protein n=1 Tax=Brachybacterium endophyticum TaxID=2182385 RepID=A0A2U2RIB0_9MICO|nr:metal-binding protein [Brachybacterium endophyticum]